MVIGCKYTSTCFWAFLRIHFIRLNSFNPITVLYHARNHITAENSNVQSPLLFSFVFGYMSWVYVSPVQQLKSSWSLTTNEWKIWLTRFNMLEHVVLAWEQFNNTHSVGHSSYPERSKCVSSFHRHTLLLQTWTVYAHTFHHVVFKLNIFVHIRILIQPYFWSWTRWHDGLFWRQWCRPKIQKRMDKK